MKAVEIIGYVGYVIGALVILTSKTKSDNLADLKQRVEILEKEREYANEQHLANQKAISHLEGQLSTYKEIPLKSIAQSLEALPRLVDGNDKILNRLEMSEVILKRVNKAKAVAAEHVRTDLEDNK